jgi:hypothetical protein
VGIRIKENWRLGLALVLMGSLAPAFSADITWPQEQSLGAGQSSGSLDVGGQTRVLTLPGPQQQGQILYQLKMPNGKVLLTDRQIEGAKVLSVTQVASAVDAQARALQEKQYWQARDRELTARLKAEQSLREAEQARIRQDIARREAESQANQEVYVMRLRPPARRVNPWW